MTRAALFDVVLPGAGLVLRGRVGLGLALLVPALAVATLLTLSGLLATADFAATLRWWMIGCYGVLAAVAVAAHLWMTRGRVADPQVMRDLHRQAAQALLNDRLPEAVDAAERLTAAAPREPGAWRLLAHVAVAAGDRKRAGRAERRLADLVDEAGSPWA